LEISVTNAKAKLTNLVHRAENGDEIILTRHGKAAVRFVVIKSSPTSDQKRALLNAIRQNARQNATSGPNAARSQDFLYHGNNFTPADSMSATNDCD